MWGWGWGWGWCYCWLWHLLPFMVCLSKWGWGWCRCWLWGRLPYIACAILTRILIALLVMAKGATFATLQWNLVSFTQFVTCAFVWFFIAFFPLVCSSTFLWDGNGWQYWWPLSFWPHGWAIYGVNYEVVAPFKSLHSVALMHIRLAL